MSSETFRTIVISTLCFFVAWQFIQIGKLRRAMDHLWFLKHGTRDWRE